jgi:uracil-DNA glycosylase family 4
MFRDHNYWGKPVPSFGHEDAELLIIGLAPAAHGANRTGRMFTGDRSGEFLYRSLFQAGWATRPKSLDPNDGLELRSCYITASIHCAPPKNKPLPRELENCRLYLRKELQLLSEVRAVLVLGRIAFDSYLRTLEWPGDFPPRPSFRFAHGASYALPGGRARLFASYHPSQQNTQTGRLTPEMFRKVLEDIRQYLSKG